MIVIDRVIGYDLEKKTLTSEVEITPNSIFFDALKKQVPVYVGIEYMAQTIAAFSGIYLAKKENSAAKMGFVIGARNYECFVPAFNLGQLLRVEVEQLFFDSELGSFDCIIFDGERKLAQAQINVFQPASPKDFF